jgi:hypothetical protein
MAPSVISAASGSSLEFASGVKKNVKELIRVLVAIHLKFGMMQATRRND